MHRVIIIMVSCFSWLCGQAQITIRFLDRGGDAFQAHALWELELQALGQDGQLGRLQGELRDPEGQVAFRASSEKFRLQAGPQVMSDLGTESSSWTTDSLSTDLIYQWCVTYVSIQNLEDGIKTCRPVRIRHQDLPRSNTSMGDLQFSGESRLSWQLSNRQSLFQRVPASYLRWQFNPMVSVKGIPLRGRVYLSTEHHKDQYRVNALSIDFDVRDLQGLLQSLALEKVQKAQDLQNMGKSYDRQLLDKLSAIREAKYQDALQALQSQYGALPDEAWLEKARSLEQIPRIEKTLDHPMFKEVHKEWQSWEKELKLTGPDRIARVKDSLYEVAPTQYEDLLMLLSRHQQWQKLMDKKQELERLKQEMAKVEALQSKIQEAEALKEMDYRELLNDPEIIQQLGLYSQAQKLFSSIQKMGVGTVFPDFSPLTIQGIRVGGLQLAVSPGKWYAEVLAGKLQEPFRWNDSTLNALQGMALAAKLGYGLPNKTHLHLILSQMDQSGNLNSPHAETRPGTNTLLGLTGGLSFWQDRLTLSGELIQSQWRPTGPGGEEGLIWQQGQVTRQALQGWAGRAEAGLRLFAGKTRLMGQYLWVGPSYYSLGAPVLINDRNRYALRYSQSLWQGKAQVELYHRHDEDNLGGYREVRTLVEASGLRVHLKPGPRLPYVSLNVAPFFQRFNPADSLNRSVDRLAMTLNSGYTFRLGSVQLSNTLMYSLQQGRSQEGPDFQLHSFSFSQVWTGNVPGSLQYHLSYVSSDHLTGQAQTLSLDLSGSWTLASGWSHQLGGRFMESKGDAPSRRAGLYYQSSFALHKHLRLSLRLEASWITSPWVSKDSYPEYLGGGEIYSRW